MSAKSSSHALWVYDRIHARDRAVLHTKEGHRILLGGRRRRSTFVEVFLSLPHMALLVVTGLPCSGRSTRVKEIQSYFESRLESNPSLSRVCVIQDADVHVDRHVYECMLTAPLHDSSTHGGTRARRLS